MRAFPDTVLPRLLELVADDGYRLYGPTIRDGAIVYDEIDGADDLPRGFTDQQAPGHYRLVRRDDARWFGFVVGPESWKRRLMPPREPLVQISRRGGSMNVQPVPDTDDRVAYIGVRACELAAHGILDRVLTGGPFVDRRYARRREQALVIAVNCLEPGDLCFCASMDTGPRATGGYDLCLTEMSGRFLVEVGSERGQAILDRMQTEGQTEAATPADRSALSAGIERARGAMGRTVDPVGLPELLFGNLEHPRWDDVASRCLSCGNCTHVCPTCFCHTVDSESVVGTPGATMSRHWDSCFTPDHSYIHGERFRPTVRTRYRQWLTHKMGAWVSQFGESGCVGCGRCIAWCPAAIDITEELAALRQDASAPVPMPEPPHHPPVAGDPMVPVPARVVDVHRESRDVVTLRLEPRGPFFGEPGQFNMLSVPGVGEPPISISGQDGGTIMHTIREVGAATRALGALKPGDSVGLRGPFGSSWPLQVAKGRNVMVIAGGIGLAPLRDAILRMLARPEDYPSVRLLYGARTPAELLFDDELLDWNDRHPHFKASVTVNSATARWNGHVGFVTNLIRRKEASPHAIYMLCGPEIMMRACVGELRRLGVAPQNIYVSMERNMQCAAGFCGRCQLGPFFVCKDGPVFRYDRVAFLFDQEGY